ncbi:PQQ-dependent sugar dehydrogenase [Oryzobacter sp. R7]|uniref:PQQ-dependent sugar dehydrogenase n=1 Tax=Oryzobacter faecalis TaxID=3388656 RepID=UPI00398D3A3C
MVRNRRQGRTAVLAALVLAPFVALSPVVGATAPGVTTAAATALAPPTLATATVASGLVVPWDVGFLPDGSMVVTERPGLIRVYASGSPGAALLRTVEVPGVRAQGESGLLGLAVDVDFASNRSVYVCASRDTTGTNGWKNHVLRYTVATSGEWSAPTVVVADMAAASTHNGCALEMDPSGHLWVGMGDAANASLAQNRSSLNGKVLRVTRTGAVPATNPVIGGVRDEVWSMGHRNPQGLAFRPGTTELLEVEHGPSVNDEVNRIVPGGNYGWPCYTGDGQPNSTSGCQAASGYLAPLWASGSSTLATSGAAIARGSQWADFVGNLFVPTLKESDLRRFVVGAGPSLSAPVTHFNGTWGRLRAATVGPGGQLYLTTSNGSNDRVIRVSPSTPVVTRASGADRYATAAAVSAAAYPGGATDVLVATGADFPDALAGGAAAGRLGMPVLLTARTSLPASSRAELDRLNPQRIVVVGGTGVVDASVLAALQPYASSGQVTRVAGSDRYATAAAVSRRWYSPGVSSVFVATGADFADALAGTPAAALRDAPLLLVTRDGIPPATAAELQRLDPRAVHVLGGTGAVSSAVASALDGYTTGPVVRLAGADRYATGQAVGRAFFTTADAWVASGATFPDALTGGAAAGALRASLVMAAPTSVPLTSGQELLRLSPDRVTLVGGAGALSDEVAAATRRLVATP